MVAVVLDAELRPVGQPGPGKALARPRGLRVRERQAGDAVAGAGRDLGEPAPAAADLEDVRAGGQGQLGENALVLRLLREGQRLAGVAVEEC